ncbi:MAG: hypothetical protein ABIZ49_06055 [Opitutaceae bacterium]
MISVEATDRFRDRLRKLGLNRDEVLAAMNAAAACWGRPHLHGGIGIRRLRSGLFECRCGRSVRLVFFHESEVLLFDFAGNHDEVQAYLRNLR